MSTIRAHDTRLRAVPAQRARGGLGPDDAGDGAAVDGGGGASARGAGGRARAGRGRQRHRRGRGRGLHAGGRPPGHGELRGRRADPGPPGLDRRDLRGLGRRALPAPSRAPTSSAPSTRGDIPIGAAAHGRARLARRLVRRARALGHAVVHRRGRPPRSSARSTASRPRRFSASTMANNAERYRRFPTSAAIFLPGGKPHAAGPALRAVGAGRDDQGDGGGRGALAQPRPRRRHPRRARRVLQGRHRPAHRGLPRARGRAHAAGGPGRVPGRGRARAEDHLPRLRGRGLRLLVPGAGVPADAEPDRALRLARARPQHAARAPHHGRGDEARLRGPRGLLRRSALREGARRRRCSPRPTRTCAAA